MKENNITISLVGDIFPANYLIIGDLELLQCLKENNISGCFPIN